MTSETDSTPLRDVTDAVRDLAALMQDGRLTKIDLVVGDVSIRLRAATSLASARIDAAPAAVVEMVAVAEAAPDRDDHVVTAPMIGTFYTAPAPGEPPFVRPGDQVDAGQTIGLIEAMKIMNEIPADRAGVVAEILATNAQAVEYGSPLIRLVPAGDEG